jgi:hypothetical protein
VSHSFPRTAAPPCLPLGIKDSLKEDARLLALGFWMKGGFLMWEILEGKRIAKKMVRKGRELLKGKGLLKGK